MRAYLLGIGDELLIGQVVDTNTVWMAQHLNMQGVRVVGKAVVSDDGPQICSAVMRALQEADLVLITGGLGATKDDITKRELAKLFDTELVWDEPTYAHIKRIFERMNRPMNNSHDTICYQPVAAKVLMNSQGLCPGMWFDRTDGKVVVSMPGVPFEMQAIMKDHILPNLKAHFPLSPVVHHTILTAGIGETQIAEKIAEIEDGLPRYIKLAYLPALGTVRLRLSATGSDTNALETEVQALGKQIIGILGNFVVAEADVTLATAISDALRAAGNTVSFAESCTGGFASHLMTLEAGASDVYLGSVIAYAYEVKTGILGVSEGTLEAYGAVSEACVQEMAYGVRSLMGTDYGVAISGVAGPGGGTPEKPVGTVCLAVVGPKGMRSTTVRFARDRKRNIEASAYAALNLLRLEMMV